MPLDILASGVYDASSCMCSNIQHVHSEVRSCSPRLPIVIVPNGFHQYHVLCLVIAIGFSHEFILYTLGRGQAGMEHHAGQVT